MQSALTIALAKGRLLDEMVPLFGRAEIDLTPLQSSSRKLRFKLAGANLTALVVRSADVPTYVDYGAADLGITGRDVIEEEGRDLYEMLDLGLGACRMVVAAPKDAPSLEGRALRIATKFPNITRRHFMARGIPVEVIKLYGSVELGVLCGLSDRIVDIVASGETLRQNRLEIVDEVMDISARLVVNRASLKTRRAAVDALIQRLRPAVSTQSLEREQA